MRRQDRLSKFQAQRHDLLHSIGLITQCVFLMKVHAEDYQDQRVETSHNRKRI